MRLKSRIIWLSVALAGILLAGTVGFAIIDGRSLFEGFYFTLTTLTTIGYGELWHVSRAARIFNKSAVLEVGWGTPSRWSATRKILLADRPVGWPDTALWENAAYFP